MLARQGTAEIILTVEQNGATYQIAITCNADRQTRISMKDGQSNLLSEATLTQVTKGPYGKTYWQQTPLGGQVQPPGAVQC